MGVIAELIPAVRPVPMPPARWLVVANCDIPALREHGHAFEADGLTVFARNVRDAELDRGVDLTSMTRLGSEHAESTNDNNTLEVGANGLCVHISTMNVAPVFVAANRAAGRFAVFNDFFLAPLLLRALALPIELRDFSVRRDDATPLRGVYRLEPDSRFTAVRDRDGWTLEFRRSVDRLHAMPHGVENDVDAAGASVIKALERAVGDLGACYEDRAVTCMLSGGIDSATVAYLAASVGMAVRPYSVGTPWGDEFDAAEETASVVGAQLARVRFDEEQLVEAIPDTIRWLAMHDAEMVDIAVTTTAFLKHGQGGDDPIVTGYGNDLLNGGLFDPARLDELGRDLVAAVDRTRYSNEYSPLQALAYGRAVAHPYWDWRTIRASLAVAAECKVVNGQGKYHFRRAMEERLPASVAWRPKVAMHHGGRLAQGLASRIERDAGASGRKGAVYRGVLEVLIRLAEHEPLRDVNSGDVYERGMALARERAVVI